MAFRIRSLAFDEGGWIPARHTGEGEDLSPALQWQDVPPGTRTLALVMDDPDAPGGVWTHWILWDIPPTETSLPEGFKPGRLGMSGVNDFGREGYNGPMPPRGHGPHRYYFRLYALHTRHLMISSGVKRHEFDKALLGHIIDEVSTVGRYERK